MKYCPTCGSQLDDSAQFCPKCGHKQTEQAVQAQSIVSESGKRLHCPNCRSIVFSPIVETTSEGGTVFGTPLSEKISVTAYSSQNTHRNYWMCQSCGTKFRNLQNLEEELKKNISIKKFSLPVSIVFLAITILLMLGLISDPIAAFLLFIPTVAVGTLTFVIFIYWLSAKTIVDKLVKEKAYLEKHCFD